MLRTTGLMPLQTKVSLTLLGVVAAFTLFSFVVLRAIITPAFNDLELQAAASDQIRAERAMQNDLENLAAITADWAPWDDIYDPKSDLERPTLENLGLDIMAVFSLDDTLMWSRVLANGQEYPSAALGILNVEDPTSARLIRHASSSSRTLGIVQTGLGPALISSRPILMSDDSGAVAGALVMGQFLNETRLQRIRDRTAVAMTWLFTGDPATAAAVEDIGMLPSAQDHAQITDSAILRFRVFPDISGAPLLIMRTDTPRRISALGAQTVNAGLLLLGVAGVLVTIVMWFLLSQTIFNPLDSLAAHIKRIRDSGDLTRRSGLAGAGEIGALAEQFDNLTTEVHDARQALLEQSFKAGKADTAAEVLHNIRNAMTPLINGLDRLGRALNVAGNLRYDDALAQIEDPECPPERQQKFVQYLAASFRHIEDTNLDAAEDLRIVASQARQVEAILADQERFANAAPVREAVPVDEVLTEAANVIPKNTDPAVRVDFDAGLGDFRVQAHKTGLLQVLGNLILNAFESIQRTQLDKGCICLTASDETLGDKKMVRVTIRDNGRGFTEAVAKRIFQRGFTSKKKDDTNGLGLHWCANAVAGMGGKIVAESLGEGQGAEFHVLLPAAQGG